MSPYCAPVPRDSASCSWVASRSMHIQTTNKFLKFFCNRERLPLWLHLGQVALVCTGTTDGFIPAQTNHTMGQNALFDSIGLNKAAVKTSLESNSGWQKLLLTVSNDFKDPQRKNKIPLGLSPDMTKHCFLG